MPRTLLWGAGPWALVLMNRRGTTSNSAARNKTNGEITLRWIISWCIRDLAGIWAYLFVTALNLLLLNIFIIYLSYCWDIDDAKTFSFHHLLKKNIRKLDLFTFWQCLIHKYNNNLYLLLKGIKAAQIQHNYYLAFRIVWYTFVICSWNLESFFVWKWCSKLVYSPAYLALHTKKKQLR